MIKRFEIDPTIFEPTNESQPPKNVFALENPSDMLHKLVWEIRELRSSLHPDVDEFPWSLAPAYRAYNCALTAWHLADWTWQSCTEDQRNQIIDKFGFALSSNNRKNLTRFLRCGCSKLSRTPHLPRDRERLKAHEVGQKRR